MSEMNDRLGADDQLNGDCTLNVKERNAMTAANDEGNVWGSINFTDFNSDWKKRLNFNIPLENSFKSLLSNNKRLTAIKTYKDENAMENNQQKPLDTESEGSKVWESENSNRLDIEEPLLNAQHVLQEDSISKEKEAVKSKETLTMKDMPTVMANDNLNGTINEDDNSITNDAISKEINEPSSLLKTVPLEDYISVASCLNVTGDEFNNNFDTPNFFLASQFSNMLKPDLGLIVKPKPVDLPTQEIDTNVYAKDVSELLHSADMPEPAINSNADNCIEEQVKEVQDIFSEQAPADAFITDIPEMRLYTESAEIENSLENEVMNDINAPTVANKAEPLTIKQQMAFVDGFFRKATVFKREENLTSLDKFQQYQREEAIKKDLEAKVLLQSVKAALWHVVSASIKSIPCKINGWKNSVSEKLWLSSNTIEMSSIYAAKNDAVESDMTAFQRDLHEYFNMNCHNESQHTAFNAEEASDSGEANMVEAQPVADADHLSELPDTSYSSSILSSDLNGSSYTLAPNSFVETSGDSLLLYGVSKTASSENPAHIGQSVDSTGMNMGDAPEAGTTNAAVDYKQNILAEVKQFKSNGIILYKKKTRLFRFDENKIWKEHASGCFEIWKQLDARVYNMFFCDSNNKLTMYMKMDKDMKIDYMNNSHVICHWAHFNYMGSERGGSIERLACRFRNSNDAAHFKSIVENCIELCNNAAS